LGREKPETAGVFEGASAKVLELIDRGGITVMACKELIIFVENKMCRST
jgi:hypothetical protein